MAELVKLDEHSTADAVLQQSVDQQILRHTVRIMDRSDPHNGGGTGVTIEHSGRFFVVTAAHVLPENHEFAVLLRDGVSNTFEHFDGVFRNEARDIAVMEIQFAHIAQFKNWHGFVTEMVYQRGRYPSTKVPITITGYPGMTMNKAGEFRSSNSSSVHLINVGSLNYETSTIQKVRWPRNVNFQRPINNKHDIFFEYRRGPQEVKGRDMRLLEPATDPQTLDRIPFNGMSGAGVWIPGFHRSASGISVPRAWLLAIQTSYPQGGKGNWIRGTRISAVQELLEDVCS